VIPKILAVRNAILRLASALPGARLFQHNLPEPDIRIAALCGGLTLHHDLGLKTFEVAKDRGDCGHTSVALKAKEAVFAHHISVDQDLVPRLRVTDIIDRDIVVPAPEKRHAGEGCAAAACP
jgi:hypothetical protein